MKTTISAVACAAALALIPLPAPPASAGEEQATCRGLEVTHTGEDGKKLEATEGADVVVTNGARRVVTLGGNDVICVTGRSGYGTVLPGPGSDVVDMTAHRGPSMHAKLVVSDADSDLYVGRDRDDWVSVLGEGSGAGVQAETGSGADAVLVGKRYRGSVTAALGRGSDRFFPGRETSAVEADGGQGRDALAAYCAGCPVSVDVGDGTYSFGSGSGSLVGFDDVVAWAALEGGIPPSPVTVRGDEGRNAIVVQGCDVTVEGFGGNDRLKSDVFEYVRCSDQGVTFRGGAGNDRLRGQYDDDLLVGGPGDDVAIGGKGTDRCVAETEKLCET